MAVYREGFKAIEEIKKLSVNIFNDACDFGAPTKKGDKIWNTAKQLVDWYKIEGTRKHDKYSTGESVSVEVKLIDEWAVSDERKTLKEATEKYRVNFVTCNSGKCKNMSGYIYVEKIK